MDDSTTLIADRRNLGDLNHAVLNNKLQYDFTSETCDQEKFKKIVILKKKTKIFTHFIEKRHFDYAV